MNASALHLEKGTLVPSHDHKAPSLKWETVSRAITAAVAGLSAGACVGSVVFGLWGGAVAAASMGALCGIIELRSSK